YAQTVTLSKQDVSLLEVFREIKKQTDYNLICNSKIIKETPVVSIHVEKATLEETLDQLLTPNGLLYFIQGNSIVIKKNKVPLPDKNEIVVLQDRQISGKVIDESGQAI